MDILEFLDDKKDSLIEYGITESLHAAFGELCIAFALIDRSGAILETSKPEAFKSSFSTHEERLNLCPEKKFSIRQVDTAGFLLLAGILINSRINFYVECLISLQNEECTQISKAASAGYVPALLSVLKAHINLLSVNYNFQQESLVLAAKVRQTALSMDSMHDQFQEIASENLCEHVKLEKINAELSAALEQLKISKQAVQQRDERFRSFTEHTPDGIIITDNSFNIQYFNRAAETIFGYSQEEIIGLPGSLMLPQLMRNSSQAKSEVFDSSLVTGFIGLTHELIAARKDGTEFPVEFSLVSWEADSQKYYSIIIRDITLKKRAKEEQIRLAAAVEQAYEAIVITDKDGTIQYVNPAFEKITGYSRSEALGKNPSILKSGRHTEGFYQSLWETITRGEVWRGHFINKHKNGTLFEEEAAIAPLRDARGQTINFLGVKRDVTLEVKLEQQYRQAQKMEAIGTLAGGIAHDFNNILSAIIGYTEIALGRADNPSTAKGYLNEVLEAADRATDLVRQILTFCRQTEQEEQPVSPKAIIKEALKLLRASLPATIEVLQTIKSDLYIMGDPTQVHQIIMNLCTNASHAMKEKGGILAVALDDIELDNDFVMQHPGLKEGRYIRLTVSDTGCGISSQIIDRIFEPFFTTKKTGEGTGLGLSVVHGIVKNHGGEIIVTSEEGKGTLFTLYFPVVYAAPEKNPGPQAAAPKGNERILFVDDELTIAKTAKILLESLGYSVTAYTSSMEALEAFRSNPQGFDLIITDYTMPDMTGPDLAKQIKVIREDIPVILCTGYSNKELEEKIRDSGIKSCLKKPLHKATLGLTIRQVLDSP